MNAEQLNAIKERAEKAIPGPWYHNRHNEITTPNGARLSQTVTGIDAEFIAHVREDIPALVAEVERLKDENSSLKRSLEYIAPRKSNPDWTIAHNALAVWGRAK